MLSMLNSGGRIHLALELIELYLKAIEKAHTTHSIPILQSHSPDFFHDRTADSKKLFVQIVPFGRCYVI